MAAQSEHEEKKLKFMGRLFANLAFHRDIDRDHANTLVRVAKDLSYRQLCLLAAIVARTQRPNSIWQPPDQVPPGAKDALDQELRDLISKGIATEGGEDWLNDDYVNFDSTVARKFGFQLHQLMDLGLIESEDTERQLRLLAYAASAHEA